MTLKKIGGIDMENALVLVDIFDNIIGESSKIDAHIKPCLHRAFSVYLLDGNKMLLQKRNIDKYHSGGKWANACCSHFVKGEKGRDTIKKRLKDELGIYSEVNYLYKFMYYSKYDNDMYEYEYDHVYVGNLSEKSKIDFNPLEVEEYKWVDIKILENALVEKPDKFATWFVMSCPKVIEYIKNK